MAEVVWDYTMCGVLPLYNLYSSLKYIFDNEIEGDIIECGVLLGGCTMLIEKMCKEHDFSKTRRVFALDTFAGFVRRTDGLDVDLVTGDAVCRTDRNINYVNASTHNMKSIGFDRLNVVKGDVLDTIPTLDVQQIAILRLDTDTYDTTKFELEVLYDRVVPGGVVIIDDYGFTLGCKKAVDDFGAGRRIFPQRIDRFCRTWVKSAP